MSYHQYTWTERRWVGIGWQSEYIERKGRGARFRTPDNHAEEVRAAADDMTYSRSLYGGVERFRILQLRRR